MGGQLFPDCATLREAAGRYRREFVVDADGSAVPFAELQVTPPGTLSYIAMEGDAQRIRLFTDGCGRRELFDLPSGDVAVTARLGPRFAMGKLDATGALTLVLDPAK